MNSNSNVHDNNISAKNGFFQQLKMLTNKGRREGSFKGYLIVKTEKDQTSTLTLASPIQAFIEKCAGALGFRDLTDPTLVELEAIALLRNNKQWIKNTQMSREERDIVDNLVKRVELAYSQVFTTKVRPAQARLNEVITELTSDTFQELSNIPSEKVNLLDRFVQINRERLKLFEGIVEKLLETGRDFQKIIELPPNIEPIAPSLEASRITALPATDTLPDNEPSSIEDSPLEVHSEESSDPAIMTAPPRIPTIVRLNTCVLEILASPKQESSELTPNIKIENTIKAEKTSSSSTRKITAIVLGVLGVFGLAWGGAHLYHQYHAVPLNLRPDSNIKPAGTGPIGQDFKETIRVENLVQNENPATLFDLFGEEDILEFDEEDFPERVYSEDLLQNKKSTEPVVGQSFTGTIHPEDLMQNPKPAKPAAEAFTKKVPVEEQGFIRRIRPDFAEINKVKDSRRTERGENKRRAEREENKKRAEREEADKKHAEREAAAKKPSGHKTGEKKGDSVHKIKQQTSKLHETEEQQLDEPLLGKWKKIPGFRFYNDFCSTLQVKVNATQEEIRSAYNQAVLAYHPDKQAQQTLQSQDDKQKNTEELMKLRKAYKYFRSRGAKTIRTKMEAIRVELKAKQAEIEAKKAFKEYKKAADQGDVLSQYKVGECYFNGWGVKNNKATAIRWFQLAADHGHEDAKVMLEKLKLNT